MGGRNVKAPVKTTEKIIKFHNIKKCTVFQNNENLDAHIAATGFPYAFETAIKFTGGPVRPRALGFDPHNTRIQGWCWDNLLEFSEKDILLSNSPDFNPLKSVLYNCK
jgi:hypothetical protein